ncbi:MAG: type II toxin-antitoxin system VapC family toxin [Candidatus Aenigmarchaeota archaeon]|nr:type II toxin-antitoxin system VapC family toxin [Candidatus Aenigmarchaeota archaeon]
MPVLDTDILVGALRGDIGAERRILAIGENARFTTTISAVEIFQGAFLHAKKEEKLGDAFRLFSHLNIYEFDYPASLVAADIFARNRLSGNIVDAFDVLIASVCLAKNETLITRNISDFSRIPRLKTEKW